jgi:hypothetical protein
MQAFVFQETSHVVGVFVDRLHRCPNRGRRISINVLRSLLKIHFLMDLLTLFNASAQIIAP